MFVVSPREERHTHQCQQHTNNDTNAATHRNTTHAPHTRHFTHHTTRWSRTVLLLTLLVRWVVHASPLLLMVCTLFQELVAKFPALFPQSPPCLQSLTSQMACTKANKTRNVLNVGTATALGFDAKRRCVSSRSGHGPTLQGADTRSAPFRRDARQGSEQPTQHPLVLQSRQWSAVL